MAAIVTKQSLVELFTNSNEELRIQAIGRALVALFNRQTDDEKGDNSTNHQNAMGFTGADARSGSLTAKYFLKHRTLLDWQVEMWTKENNKGTMRLAKYHRQLDEVARRKAGKG